MERSYICMINLFNTSRLVPEVKGTSLTPWLVNKPRGIAVADSDATQPERDNMRIHFASLRGQAAGIRAEFAAHGRSIVLRECPTFFVVCVSEVTSH